MNTVETEPPQPEQDFSESRLPVPIAPAHPQASERAPTLIAGATPGKQGQVTVWAPSMWRARLGVLATISLVGIMVWSTSLRTWDYIFILEQFALSYIGIHTWVSVWRRPRYITTDDAGIGITTRTGSRALRWDEIHSLFQRGKSDYVLNSGYKAINLDLLAHPPEKRKALASLIIEKANLHKQPARRGYYERWMLPSQKAASPAITAPGSASAPFIDESALSHSDEELPGEVPRWAQAHRH